LRRVLTACVLSSVLADLMACQPTTPAPAVDAPTALIPTAVTISTPTPPPEPTAIDRPTTQATSQPTVEPTARPTIPPLHAFSSDVTIARGPYLQSVTSESIIIAWETDQPSEGEIYYGQTEAYNSRVTDLAVDMRHALTLTGLVPYTTYHYRVVTGGESLSEDLTFRTAAGPDQTAFTFVAFGDTRTRHRDHQAVVDRMLTVEPDFVLHTGDLVTAGSAAHQWNTFFEIERELMARAPLFPALGNHEGMNPNYFDLFYLPGSERWYTFDYGNARFVCLQVDGFAEFGADSEQYAWLEETLSANTRPWLFVYFHVPPYSSVSYDSTGGEDEQSVRSALTPLFEQHDVDMVFSGHMHSYERNEVNSITYVVTAGGGAPLYAMKEREPTQVVFAMAHHFVVVKIDGNRLEATVLSSEGDVLDKFERSAD